MKIAILGIRGIPANYGGYETFAEEVAPRLVERGHKVTVYCRPSSYPEEKLKEHKGVELVFVPSIRHKYLDTVSHTFFATLHLILLRPDVAYYCNNANAYCVWFARLLGIKTILNTDGLEWKRAKWNWLGKAFYRISAHVACWFPHLLISDALAIQDYYLRIHKRDSLFIPYGGYITPRGQREEFLSKFGVEKEKYFYWVSRFEPENNPHLVVLAFEKVKTDMKLLMVGNAHFSDDYIKSFTSTKDPRIIFPGPVYGEKYVALHSNAHCYINSNEVGGTHITVLDAMGAAGCVLTSDIVYNLEVLNGTGISFRCGDIDDLAEKMQWLADNPGEARKFGSKAQERIRNVYNWDLIAEDTEKACESVLGERSLMDSKSSRVTGHRW